MNQHTRQNREANLAELAMLAKDVKAGPVSDTEWKDSRGALERHKEAVEASPVAKAAFDRATQRIDRRTRALRELRKARSLTQAELGKVLGMDQSEVSRLEQRSDLLLSTLKRFVAATGGELHLVVTYPDNDPLDLELGELLPADVADVS